MGTHMKTTIEIADPLLARARAVAAAEGLTLRELVESGLREVLAHRERAPGGYALPDRSVLGEGLSPELADAPWGEVRDTIYFPDVAVRNPLAR